MKRKRLFIVIAVLVVAGAGIAFKLGGFGSSGAGGVMPQYLTVAEARALPGGQAAKVGGDVAPGSIDWNGSALLFTLTGEGADIRVSYPNVAPNDFKPGTKLLVEGTTTDAGLFLATSLQTTTSPLCRACHG